MERVIRRLETNTDPAPAVASAAFWGRGGAIVGETPELAVTAGGYVVGKVSALTPRLCLACALTPQLCPGCALTPWLCRLF
jgi:hypothetical protein